MTPTHDPREETRMQTERGEGRSHLDVHLPDPPAPREPAYDFDSTWPCPCGGPGCVACMGEAWA